MDRETSERRTPWDETLDRDAHALACWMREDVSEECCALLDDLHPDSWRAAAEVAIRAGRWERDPRPFTTVPELSEDAPNAL